MPLKRSRLMQSQYTDGAKTQTCCGPTFLPLQEQNPLYGNLPYRAFMAPQQPVRATQCASRNCCPGGKCDFCAPDYGFCTYRDANNTPRICMSGYNTK